jgi:hypothetical protein
MRAPPGSKRTSCERVESVRQAQREGQRSQERGSFKHVPKELAKCLQTKVCKERNGRSEDSYEED